MDLQVFPHRILGSDRTEMFLNEIEALDGVKRTVIQGPRLPPEDPNENPKYAERRVINVHGKEIDLKVKTGRIFIDVSNDFDIVEVKDSIDKICRELLPFGFDIDVGKFIRTQKTVTDNIKYGDESIPDELVGMTDQSAKLRDRVTILKKN
ncbi:MAG: methyl-coenzyme M reductase operon protein D [Methanobrevibacter sp.]|jgi:methyl-coenzyme M reductase subunit D|nr:methyl-coenzyme M reductase operon protein D [Candidatus Methanovirga basalitermitum]